MKPPSLKQARHILAFAIIDGGLAWMFYRLMAGTLGSPLGSIDLVLLSAAVICACVYEYFGEMDSSKRRYTIAEIRLAVLSTAFAVFLLGYLGAIAIFPEALINQQNLQRWREEADHRQ